jgi:hypothetical protein
MSPLARTVRGSALGSLVVALAIAGCARQPSGVPAERRAQWEAALVAERAAKDAEFKTSPTSPMAGVERFVIRAPASGWVVLADFGLRVVTEPVAGSPLSFAFTDAWQWSGTPERACRDGEEGALAPGPVPEGALFRVGRVTLATYLAGSGLVVIAFDPERAEIRAFERLRYFPPDAGFVVAARREAVTPPEPVTLATSRNLEKRYLRVAKLHFRLAGRDLALSAFKAGADDDILFVPFADATSGAETYGSGRFLEIPEAPGDTIEVDFNRAFNPLCNYSPAYNCPLPPAENRLDVAIEAGEKTYPHS